jgi:glutamate/tyrosine decarboxylase-like PLP-dependent enzyme
VFAELEDSRLEISSDGCFEAEEHLLREALRESVAYLRQSVTAAPYPDAGAITLARENHRALPDAGLPADKVLKELAGRYGPATVRTHSGRYLGFVHGSSFPVGMAAKWLSTVWDQNTPLFALSPATALLETQTEEWIVELLGLAEGTAVGFVSSSSQAILAGLHTGRQTLLERLHRERHESSRSGAPPIRVVLGEQSHVAVQRALSLLGIGDESIEVVPADSQGRLEVDRLPPLDGRTLLVLQAGNIYSGAFDRFAEIIPAARRAGAWVHVDGAFGLWAAASPVYRGLTSAVELADSLSVDCHKTLNTPFSCGLIVCRDRSSLRRAFGMSGAYLEPAGERNGMEYSPDMARRCMVAEVWATLRFLGRSGVAKLVEGLCAHARELSRCLQPEGFVVVHDVVFNQVCVRLATDEQTLGALELVQRGGVLWCGGGHWQGRRVIRLSVSSWRTTRDDVRLVVDELRRAKERVT